MNDRRLTVPNVTAGNDRNGRKAVAGRISAMGGKRTLAERLLWVVSGRWLCPSERAHIVAYVLARSVLLAALILSAPASAKKPTERLIELSRGIAQNLIGLSPSGADIYARRAAASAENTRQFDAVSRLRVLIGEELAREAPNRLRLAKLSDAVAREEASLISTAFQLSDADRRKLGKVIARNNGTALGI